jgi:hypothetical protein
MKGKTERERKKQTKTIVYANIPKPLQKKKSEILLIPSILYKGYSTCI